MRWANIGWFYHWGTKQYDFTRGKQDIGARAREVCKNAVKCVPWDAVFNERDDDWGNEDLDWKSWDRTYGRIYAVTICVIEPKPQDLEPDAGIVNFYQTKDTLMAHVDRSEVCATSPLVSIS